MCGVHTWCKRNGNESLGRCRYDLLRKFFFSSYLLLSKQIHCYHFRGRFFPSTFSPHLPRKRRYWWLPAHECSLSLSLCPLSLSFFFSKGIETCDAITFWTKFFFQHFWCTHTRADIYNWNFIIIHTYFFLLAKWEKKIYIYINDNIHNSSFQMVFDGSVFSIVHVDRDDNDNGFAYSRFRHEKKERSVYRSVWQIHVYCICVEHWKHSCLLAKKMRATNL